MKVSAHSNRYPKRDLIEVSEEIASHILVGGDDTLRSAPVTFVSIVVQIIDEICI